MGVKPFSSFGTGGGLISINGVPGSQFKPPLHMVTHVSSMLLNKDYRYSFGLEAESKLEFLLAMASMCKASPKALLVCNGYKDEEYVSLVLTAK